VEYPNLYITVSNVEGNDLQRKYTQVVFRHSFILLKSVDVSILRPYAGCRAISSYSTFSDVRMLGSYHRVL
jgi:hypothetical protein